MKKRIRSIALLSVIVAGIFFVGCSSQDSIENTYPDSFELQVENPVDVARTDAPVTVKIADIKATHTDFNPEATVVLANGKEIPSQYIAGDPARILFTLDFQPEETKSVKVRYATSGMTEHNYPKRTQAVLGQKTGGSWDKEERVYNGGHFEQVTRSEVPDVQKDHSWYYQFEGPGWESGKVGYRLYLDQRNAIDIFGKKTTDMVLDTVGSENFSSYHEMGEWGMDILKVGEAFGLGAVGLWKNGSPHKVAEVDDITFTVTANGPLFSEISIDYNGWTVGNEQYNLTSQMAIHAGSRLTKHSVEVSGNAKTLAASLVNHENTEYVTSKNGSGQWQYIATYGPQDIEERDLGMVVFYNADEAREVVKTDLDYYVLLEPKANKAAWYFGAAWSEEPNGIASLEEFKKYLDVTQQQLNHPISVELMNE